MENKVILISIDGMRPDGVQQCGNPYVEELKKMGSYTFDARTVFPPVTLPCHMSMFHSVPPERHGVTTNVYMPPVRPINGLFEQIKRQKGKSAMYYGWEPLRDIARPENLVEAEYVLAYSAAHTDGILTDRMLRYQKENPNLDFIFLYMVETDEKGGHDSGWMTETYLDYIHHAINNVKRVVEQCGKDYTIIITADHGGHGRNHGDDLPEDMTIPMFFIGKEFEAGRELHGVRLLDLAPTIADIMGVTPADEWEGRSLLQEVAK